MRPELRCKPQETLLTSQIRAEFLFQRESYRSYPSLAAVFTRLTSLLYQP
jgi:hypothetical protein